MYAAKAVRYRWQALGTAWALCILGWIGVAAVPDKFTSATRIYLDTDSMLRPLMKGIAVDTNLLSEVDMMQRTLLSKPNLQRVARLAELDKSLGDDAMKLDDFLNSLAGRIKVTSPAKNLFVLSADDKSPTTAKAIIDALVSIFVESNLGATRKDMQGAIRFIEDQIKEYEQQLEAAENRVAEFRQKNL